MDQVIYFFTHLFDTESWPPRWHCGSWSDFHGWLYIFSDLGIWAAYFAIPILIIRIVAAKKLPLIPVFWLFAAFILLCGLTHLIDAMIFYYPAYRLSALVRFLTAVVSWVTVIALVKLLPQVFALKSPDDLQKEIDQRIVTEEILKNKAVELEQANHELDRFVYSASHDLRAPLTSVLGLINLAGDETSDPKQQQYLEMMRNSINDLDLFIHGIIEYSKNSRQDIQEREIDFEKIFDQAVHGLSYLENASQVGYRFDNLLTKPFHSDPHRLSIIFTNLLGNAIKYHDLRKDRPLVKVEVRNSDNNRIKITFADNGKGIEEQYVPHIFDMFYRASDTAKGSGLGLYIARQIVEKLGGTIEVISSIGVGSEFVIYLKND
jgi:chemotaxis family two-component system sensor kinase Cph1